MIQLPNFQDIITKIIVDLVNQIVGFVPLFVSALIVLGVGLLLAKLIRNVVQAVLSKAGIDKIGEALNKIDLVKSFHTEIKISAVLGQVFYFFVLLTFVTAASKMLGISAVSDLVAGLTGLIPKLVVAGLMIVIGLFLADALKQLIISLCDSFNISSGRMLGTIAFYFLLAITLINSLSQIGVNTALFESSFNLIIGGVIFAFAVGYGIASRDVMANLLSSFYSKNKFRSGQTIRIDAVQGVILTMDSTSMTIQTGNTTTIIPLQTLQTKNVEVFGE